MLYFGMELDVANRYNQKIKDFCGGIDPFGINHEHDPLPSNVGYFDICNYCIAKDSTYTHQAFKAYKSLDAYKFYENGWVQSIQCKNITTGWVCLGKVKHSQRMNLKSLQCWVAVDKDGIILSGHCECMAGQGEVCSHVGAVLFVLEAWGRKTLELNNSVS